MLRFSPKSFSTGGAAGIGVVDVTIADLNERILPALGPVPASADDVTELRSAITALRKSIDSETPPARSSAGDRVLGAIDRVAKSECGNPELEATRAAVAQLLSLVEVAARQSHDLRQQAALRFANGTAR
jgi:hypothetical protein